jgi:PIN domain nuclease of toxin-antitoxin system
VKALLDTHVLLWFRAGDERLSSKWRQMLEGRADDFFFSAASVAEISIKYLSGKLNLPEPPLALIPHMLSDLRITSLPITIQHSLALSTLPLHHGDPFDRLLIAQSRSESLPLITGDRRLAQYGVQILF